MQDADGNEHIADPSARYEKYYHSDGVAPKMMVAWDAIAITLIEHFRPDTVIDLGCSGGGLVKRLIAHGVAAVGVDGSKTSLEVCKDIMIHDLRIKDGIPWTPGSFDLVTCGDVAEHLEPQYSDVICQLCAEATKPGGHVCFGAAPPGQGGLGHVNLQSHEDWRGRLVACGLEYCVLATEAFRADLRSRPAACEAWWWQNNMQVFQKP